MTTKSARAFELANLIDAIHAGVQILSLDCFDTLLWRDVNAPRDVFADLSAEGGAIELRQNSEQAARQRETLLTGRNEVDIRAIHAVLRPGSSDAQIAASIDEELAAEARHCYGFAPTISLMHAAKARGLKIVIVSDTYLDHVQLRTLISRAAGQDVADMIDRIFCSSEYGNSKVQGLFRAVLDDLGLEPQAIHHLGDNKAADFTAPQLLGIPATHFVQFDGGTADRLRLEATAAQIVAPGIRIKRPAFQPHRPLVSMRSDSSVTARIGHDVMGPVLVGFSRWLKDEADAFAQQTGRKTHILFLLRDGFLQAKVHEQLFGPEGFGSIELSRLTAIKASLTSEDAIHEHLTTRSGQNSARTIGQHLHFTPAELPKAFNDSMRGCERVFLDAMLEPRLMKKTIQRAGQFARRLCRHLENAGVAKGDAVVLADLGYNGTVQNMVQQMLEREMDLAVAGRYLLLRESVPSGLDKKGYFGTDHYDYKALDALAFPIAVVEQFCTIAQGSVIDYRADGTPVRSTDKRKSKQSDHRDAVQSACVDYARTFANWAGQWSAATDAAAWREAAFATLARLLFLPSHDEVDLIEAFEHDANFGSNEMLQMVDVDRSIDELRRHGMLSVARARRMFVPGELRRHGLPLGLSLLATHRFHLDWNAPDLNGAGLKVSVILANANGETPIAIDAYPTHDGYYTMRVPVGKARYNAAILWGQSLSWLEITDMRFQSVWELHADSSGSDRDIAAQPLHDAMTAVDDGLFHCETGSALSFVPPPSGSFDQPLVLTITFRPIVVRKDDERLSLAA